MNDEALKILEEKKNYFETELAKTASSKEKFQLINDIEECDKEIQKLNPVVVQTQKISSDIEECNENIQDLSPIVQTKKTFSTVAKRTYERLKEIIKKDERYYIEDLTPEFAHEGDLALVCKGFDNRLKRSIAIKSLKLTNPESSLVSNSEKFGWFKKAVTEACKLSDESNFITIYEAYILDSYVDHIWGKSAPYFTMQYIEGYSLRTYISNGGNFDPKSVREFIVDIISAVIVSHRKNITHRNIRPSNIMLQKAESGAPMDSRMLLSPLQSCIDISSSHQLIRNLECKLENITEAENNINYFLEELAYLPPELFDGYQDSHEARCKTDQYMIGLLAYELLTHRLPYRLVDFSERKFKDNPIAEFQEIKESLKDGIYAFKDDYDELENCPESFKKAILQMIEKKPNKRFDSLKEARDSINRKYEYILAKESFYRCIKQEDNFIDAIYDNFEHLAKTPEELAKYHAFFGYMKSNSQLWNRHRLIIKEAILLLLAFHDQDEFSCGLEDKNILSETNILSRIAQTHVDINISGYQISDQDFERFKHALTCTICGKNHSSINNGEPFDPYFKSQTSIRSDEIKNSWDIVLKDGIKYMKLYLRKSREKAL